MDNSTVCWLSDLLPYPEVNQIDNGTQLAPVRLLISEVIDDIIHVMAPVPNLIPEVIDDQDYVIASYLIIIIALILQYLYRRFMYPLIGDPLNKKLGYKDLTHWSILSGILFALIGYFSPNYARQFIIYSCAYEGTKHMINTYVPSNKQIVADAKVSTIFANYTGTFIGIILRLILSGYYSQQVRVGYRYGQYLADILYRLLSTWK